MAETKLRRNKTMKLNETRFAQSSAQLHSSFYGISTFC